MVQRDGIGSVPETPQISVIVPTRNRPQLLRQALNSIQVQDCEAFECIVVDDGSQNVGQTEQVVRDLQDARFRLVRSRDGSALVKPTLRFAKGRALNAGIEEATTDWLAFLDDDDVYAPYRLSRGLASVHTRANVLITVARSSEFSVTPPAWRQAAALRLRKVRNPLARMVPHSSTWTLSRGLAYDVGLFRPYGVLEDWEFYSRLWPLATIWRDEAVTVSIRSHDGARDNYGLKARVEMRRYFQKSGALTPNWASRAFQLYRLSQLESRAGNHVRALTDALLSFVPIPYPRYVGQAIKAVRNSLRPAKRPA